MNRDGEKIPPDAPEPRLIEVANDLGGEQQQNSSPGSARPPERIAWIVE